jgi:uncharacterized protein (DUF2141 family)
MIKYLLLFLLVSFNNWAQKADIHVVITGFASNKGKAMLMLLDQNEKEVSKHILTIKNNQALFTINAINHGKYALKVFHDENANQKLDTNIMGIPKEKWGVSNNVPARLGPPDFKKMLFELKDTTEVKIRLN